MTDASGNERERGRESGHFFDEWQLLGWGAVIHSPSSSRIQSGMTMYMASAPLATGCKQGIATPAPLGVCDDHDPDAPAAPRPRRAASRRRTAPHPGQIGRQSGLDTGVPCIENPGGAVSIKQN